MHRTSHFDAFLPCFTYELHAQSRQLRRYRHLIGQLPVTPGDLRRDVWVSGSHITYSMCKFQYSISIPKGSLQTRFRIQDTCFGHFDPRWGHFQSHQVVGEWTYQFFVVILPIQCAGSSTLSRFLRVVYRRQFLYMHGLRAFRDMTNIHFDPRMGSLPVMWSDRWCDIWVFRGHITYSVCNFRDPMSHIKVTLQRRVYIQGAIFDHFDPHVGWLPVMGSERYPDIWVSRSHITYSLCKFYHSISIPNGSLQTRVSMFRKIFPKIF
jgi:hypothetical protein